MHLTKLIIADRDIQLVERLATFFRARGAEVKTAYDAGLVLKLMHLETPDALVLGINLLAALASARLYSLGNFEDVTWHFLLWSAAAMEFSLWLFFRWRHDKWVKFAALYGVVALGVGLAFAPGDGVDVNIFFDTAIALARKYEHGFKHTSIIHSRNLETITRMGREMDTTLFVQNGPSTAGLGSGGEGYLSFSIATPTGEGVTTPLTFTRQRRSTTVGSLRVL